MPKSLEVLSNLKFQVDKENKLIFVWILEEQKKSDEFKEMIAFARSKKYKLVTFVSGNEDMKLGLEKLVLNNVEESIVERTR
jgi:hypothetical protein